MSLMARIEAFDFSKARAFGEKKHNPTQCIFSSMNKLLIFSLLLLFFGLLRNSAKVLATIYWRCVRETSCLNLVNLSIVSIV